LIRKTEIRAIFTTGRKASVLFEKYVKTDTPQFALPSTSAANARMKAADLAEQYRMIRYYAEKD
jgi:G:T/U-mismatch repair DNA glycosylase